MARGKKRCAFRNSSGSRIDRAEAPEMASRNLLPLEVSSMRLKFIYINVCMCIHRWPCKYIHIIVYADTSHASVVFWFNCM